MMGALALTARGEFRRIEQIMQGSDCASCSTSLTSALKRIRGVESVEISSDSARIQLAAGNAVRLERVRDAIKGVGFTPKEARVTARGKAAQTGGNWTFQIEGFDQTYPLSEGKLVRDKAGRIVTIEGALGAQTDPRTPPSLEITAVRATD